MRIFEENRTKINLEDSNGGYLYDLSNANSEVEKGKRKSLSQEFAGRSLRIN
jgi:hypothetical protein